MKVIIFTGMDSESQNLYFLPSMIWVKHEIASHIYIAGETSEMYADTLFGKFIL